MVLARLDRERRRREVAEVVVALRAALPGVDALLAQVVVAAGRRRVAARLDREVARRLPARVDERRAVGELEAVEQQSPGGRLVAELGAVDVRVVAAAHEQVHVRLLDRERRRLQRADRPVAVGEAVHEPGADEPVHGILAGEGAGGRGIRPRAVPPVAGLVGDGPALVAAAVEPGEDLAGRQRVIRHRALRREGRAVEFADEVLAAGAAGHRTGVEVHDEHPLGVRRVAVDREREQVGALPDAAGRVGRAEVAEVRPRLQVVAAGEHDLVLQGLDGDHHPVRLARLGVGVAEHLRIAEVRRAAVVDRVALVLRPRQAVVEAVGERLGLLSGVGRVRLRVGARVDRDHGRVLGRAESGAVGLVDHDRAGEDVLDRTPLVVERLGDRERLLLPVHEVGAGGVAPAHVAPAGAVRVVLEEQVPGAVVVDQAVGVVHPVPLGREVQVRPVLLLRRRNVGRRAGLLRGGGHGSEYARRQCCDRERRRARSPT